MTAKGKMKLKIGAVALAFMMLVVSVIFFPLGITYSWFKHTLENKENTNLIPPTLQVSAYFEYELNGVLTQKDISDAKNIDIDLINKTAENYIGNLRVSVTYNGNVDVALRLHVLHLWSAADGSALPARSNIRFKVEGIDYATNPYTNPQGLYTNDSKVLDFILSSSLYYYCNLNSYNQGANLTEAEKLSNLYTFNVPEKQEIKFITGLNQTVIYDSNTRLKLYIMAEAVQLNRAQAVWTLPVVPTVGSQVGTK